jgi:membrane protein DedA with SNARE-associated domain
VTFATATLKQDPVFGVGMGRPYGALRRVYDPVSGARSYQPRRFIHNSYLGYWLWAGVAGVVSLVWLGVRTASMSVAAAKQLPPDEGGRAVAAGLAILALGVQATFQTSLTSRPVIATLACAIAFLDVPGLRRSRWS